MGIAKNGAIAGYPSAGETGPSPGRWGRPPASEFRDQTGLLADGVGGDTVDHAMPFDRNRLDAVGVD